MNGADHYIEAERLLDAYKLAHVDAESMPDSTPEQFEKKALALSLARVLIDKAQVHAILAQAAATAYAAVHDYYGDEARDGADWARVIRSQPVVVNS